MAEVKITFTDGENLLPDISFDFPDTEEESAAIEVAAATVEFLVRMFGYEAAPVDSIEDGNDSERLREQPLDGAEQVGLQEEPAERSG